MDFTPGHCAAFPRPIGESAQHEATNTEQDGLTAREWFAGQALAGLCANRDWTSSHSPGQLAANCFAFADAMLAEARRKHDDMEAARLAPRICRLCGHRGHAEDFCDENMNNACPQCGGPSSPAKKGE